MLYSKALTLKHLRALAAIVDAGSVTAAAGKLHVTPPAVSTQLRGLEDIVGAQVLLRGPDGKIALTPIGAELFATVRKIENALDLSYQRVTAMRTGLAGYVSVGVVSTGKYFAPGLVARMKRIHPEIEVGLKVGNREDTIEWLTRGEIELAIMGSPPQAPSSDFDELGDHPYVVIAPPEHRLAGQAKVSSGELLGETFLCRENGSGSRVLMTRYLDRIGEGRPYRSIEMGTNETIKQVVIAGLGVAIISAHTIVPELEAGRLVTLPLEGLPIIRKWYLIRLNDVAISPVAAAFRKFLLELKGDYLPSLPGK
ncbi:MAG TPA: LysR family transcriptional regulator [Thermohalobaculum sp.]|nr:LysR family transcriptional regulator [Thermohalobaculum sp.]